MRLRSKRYSIEPMEQRVLLAASSAVELFNASSAVFVQNRGQWADSSVRFALQGDGASIGMTDTGALFQLSKTNPDSAPSDPSTLDPLHDPSSSLQDILSTSFSIHFDGAKRTRPIGQNRSQSVFNYYVGDKSQWRTNVSGFESVTYSNLYKGIDLVTSGKQSSLKYEFHVGAGADYHKIKLSYNGIKGLSIDNQGRLHILTDLGELIDDAPFAYQVINGRKAQVATRYQLLDGDTYRFRITGRYDRSRALVIDPNLDWSGYLGGSDYDGGLIYGGIATDPSGNAWVTGYTSSSDFASGGLVTSYNGDYDAFVAKINSNGTLAWSSYLGGTSPDGGVGIATDTLGNTWVTGFTESSDFASGGFDTSYNGNIDAFVAKINANGSLAWSSYLGGSYFDGLFGGGIATDSSGNAWVTGWTGSSDFASGGFDTSLNGSSDAFVAKINANGSLAWSSYLGGSDYEYGYGITIDAAGNAWVTGQTSSSDFASGGFDTSYNGNGDAFVAKINANGSLAWSSYLGGSDNDAQINGGGIATDPSGNAWVTGSTSSSDFASGGIDTSYNGNGDAYVAKINANGSLAWSSYLGGTGGDGGVGIATDRSGNAWLTGWTSSSGWVSGGFDTTYNGGTYDAFVAKINANGALAWSSYLGGTGDDVGYGIAIDPSDSAWVTGQTSSIDFASGGFDTTYNGGTYDAFVAKISDAATSSTVDVGPLRFEGPFLGGVSNGTTLIGLKPQGAATFQPLLSVVGTLSYDASFISASGTFQAEVGSVSAPLFGGSLSIPVGSSNGTVTETPLAGQWRFASMDFDIQQLGFDPGRLNVGGNLILPALLGGFAIGMTGANAVSIGAAGPGLQTNFTLTGGQFNLFGALTIGAQDVGASYDASSDELRFFGQFSAALKQFGSASLTLDLSSPNGIVISPSGVSLSGEMSASNITLVPSVFEINQVSIGYDPGQQRLWGSTSVSIMGGAEIGGEIEFLDGNINRVGLNAGPGLNIQVGDGFTLDSIGAFLDHISPSDPLPWSIGGTLGLTWGGSISIPLPSWMGGDVQGYFALLDGNGQIGPNGVQLSANAKIVGVSSSNDALATGSAGLTYDFGRTATLNGNLDLLGGLFTYTGNLRITVPERLSGHGVGTIEIPSFVPVIGGTQLSGSTEAIDFTNDGTFSDDYIAGWKTINLFGYTFVAGFRAYLDGRWELLGSNNLPTVPSLSPSISSPSSPESEMEQSQTFSLTGTEPYALFSASWDNDASNVPMEIVDPMGHVYSALDPNLPGNVAVVTDLSGSKKTVIAVNSPMVGVWTVRVSDTTGLGTVVIDGADGLNTPTVNLSSPSTTVTTSQVNIQYGSTNSFGGTIGLYWDDDANGFDGVPIVTGLPASSAGSYLWDASGMPDGTYHIYAVLESGVSAPVYAYAPGAVVVPQRPQITDMNFSYDTAPNQLQFGFDRDPSVLAAAGDITLLNLTTGTVMDPSQYTPTFDPMLHSLTVDFMAPILMNGNYELQFAPNQVRDLAGNATPQGFNFDFFVLAGDANHDGVVNVADLSIVAVNWQGNGKVFTQGDFNYDGKVDLADLQILAGNWNKTPSGAGLGPIIPMPNILPLSPPPPPIPPPPVAATVTTAIKRTAPKLVTQVVS